jgi:hypothetical protein
MEPKTPFIFLLGGHDLEMAEIRRIAEAEGITFHDHNLGWGNVKLNMNTHAMKSK